MITKRRNKELVGQVSKIPADSRRESSGGAVYDMKSGISIRKYYQT
ncbi:MAG: hypothetical protein ACE5K8_07305 [Candidatus Zixiibacteriota bacterium]